MVVKARSVIRYRCYLQLTNTAHVDVVPSFTRISDKCNVKTSFVLVLLDSVTYCGKGS